MSANDNFANRIFLGGLPVSTTGSNIGDTEEVGEPVQSGPINSAWWYWTAPSTGIVTFDTQGSNFDTYLSLFSGFDLPNLSLIEADDDDGLGLTSLITQNVTAGQTYQIAVDGWAGNTGDIALNITAPPPPNDNFANAIALAGDFANSIGSNHGATGEVNEPAQNGQVNSAWWSWTAPSSGFFQVDTTGSNFDTWLSLFNGSAVDNLSLIGADDDSGPGLTSLYNLNATAGTTYPIAVDGFSNYTLGDINLNIAPTAPPNDNFANRIGLAGETANATGSNVRATEEVSEPTQSYGINSVWWTWTAPTTGNYTFDTIGSGYDTYLSVFTGFDVSSLTLVAADDDGAGYPASLISLNATAGETYQIAVDGFSSSTGPIQLNIALAPSPAPTAGAANLTETANNPLKGGTGADPLTGGTGAEKMLPFPESSASPSDPGSEFAGSKNMDLLTEGGVAMNPPSLFSPAANSAFTTLEKGVSPVFSEEKGVSPVFTHANGALAGNPGLGINSDPFRVAAVPYLVGVVEPKPAGFSVA